MAWRCVDVARGKIDRVRCDGIEGRRAGAVKVICVRDARVERDEDGRGKGVGVRIEIRIGRELVPVR